MENDPLRPTPPVLDEHERAAVRTILMRVIRSQEDTARRQEAIKEHQAKISENNMVNIKAINALTFFGFQAPTGVNVWLIVGDALGAVGYNQAVDEAKGIIPKLLQRMGVDGEAKPQSVTIEATVVNKPPVQIRTAILDYMRSVGAKGAKAAQVRQHLLDTYGLKVHEKTPGMTLYRLGKDGLVKRKGRTWFAVEGKKENEAPSGKTAGASEAGGAATPPNDDRAIREELFG
jgi:hypothetical protein